MVPSFIYAICFLAIIVAFAFAAYLYLWVKQQSFSAD